MTDKPKVTMILGIGKPERRPSGPMPLLPRAEKKPPAPPVIEEDVIEERGEGIPPEAVCFRHENEVCATCEYMDADSMCSKLKIAVSPGAGCNLHESRESDEPVEGDMEMEEEEIPA